MLSSKLVIRGYKSIFKWSLSRSLVQIKVHEFIISYLWYLNYILNGCIHIAKHPCSLFGPGFFLCYY